MLQVSDDSKGSPCSKMGYLFDVNYFDIRGGFFDLVIVKI